MRVLFRLCVPTDVGCLLMVAGAPEDSQDVLRRGCGLNGWRLACARHNARLNETTFFVTGPTARQLRAALEGDPDFDFTDCV